MILRNPSGRPVKLEILAGDDDASMALTIGAHATVDLDRYQRALDALAAAATPRGVGSVLASKEGSPSDTGAPQQQQ